MDVSEADKALSSTESQARRIAQKKNELEGAKAELEAEKGRVGRERTKLISAEREKNENTLVEISQEADNQLNAVKKLNHERVRGIAENSQKHFEEVSHSMAEQLKRMDSDALKAVNDRKASSMEKIRAVTDKSEDPFYRVKALHPTMSENDKEFLIKLPLPEHEAKNLMVTADGAYVKLSLARRFQDDVKDPENGRKTRTSSYQSVVEQLTMPSAYDMKGIQQEFKEGLVTIKVPKMKFGPPPGGDSL